ncbi:hypothetical protein A2673_01670 [Candidatus Kaiserbacteria bacterium RIFCSPHIGHO2_01_FULL_50_13]|uniref:HTH deoR-type domain-containing protein n=1 Tax=Candidatus Kaiserbacteria bacterium RIFCSPLOWO2_01_FULL_50_24 TaxID=1798507 RepID=A0A1F6EME8_9BACT|nr:MAG: hypothetical protein A2673_01670 [Candidatus Kaiserbacteria bacterium RIFCSPHIGHO2_01_FULL_50_13]OGG74829.1 MAG: hypothetical protein A3A34_00370 [Candidatus Kaiserbacteria bacterium RIFCSPLOWO2_01_FULL_50_24]OGG81412.1 MAG: hypothetical protein A3H74_03155 [Candidatus Kaiserbacteria bacterium RIFCSPLOWO2_02_FULL_51_13]
MEYLYLIAAGIVGVALGMYFGRKKQSGMPKVNEARTRQRKQNVERVLAFAREKGEITNNDVETLLGVSDPTAERYLPSTL